MEIILFLTSIFIHIWTIFITTETPFGINFSQLFFGLFLLAILVYIIRRLYGIDTISFDRKKKEAKK